MRLASIILLLACLLAACGGAQNNQADSTDHALQERAKVAEQNLVRIRDAVVKYYAREQTAPTSVSDLEGLGGGPEELAVSEDYADVGYTFVAASLKFDDAGKLVRGWFFATPRGNSDALQVRMNGVTGAFEHLPKGSQWTAAEDDEGWTPEDRAPKDS